MRVCILHAIGCRRKCRPGRGLRCGFLAQLLAAGCMPRGDVRIRRGGEGSSRNVPWERLARVGIFQPPVLDRERYVGHMLIGLEQDLDGLPASETPWGQGGYGGSLIVIVGRLESVLAAKDLPDVGDGLAWGIHEESWAGRGEPQVSKCRVRYSSACRRSAALACCGCKRRENLRS